MSNCKNYVEAAIERAISKFRNPLNSLTFVVSLFRSPKHNGKRHAETPITTKSTSIDSGEAFVDSKDGSLHLASSRFPWPKDAKEYETFKRTAATIQSAYDSIRQIAALITHYKIDKETFLTSILLPHSPEHLLAKRAIAQCTIRYDSIAEILRSSLDVGPCLAQLLSFYQSTAHRGHSAPLVMYDLDTWSHERPANMVRHCIAHDFGVPGRRYRSQEESRLRYSVEEHWVLVSTVFPELEKNLAWIVEDLEMRLKEVETVAEREGMRVANELPAQEQTGDYIVVLETGLYEKTAAQLQREQAYAHRSAEFEKEKSNSISNETSVTRSDSAAAVVDQPPEMSRSRLLELQSLLAVRLENIRHVESALKKDNVDANAFRSTGSSCGSLSMQAAKDSACLAWVIDQEMAVEYRRKSDEFEEWVRRKEQLLGKARSVLDVVESDFPVTTRPVAQYAVSRKVRNWCAHEYGVPGLSGYNAGNVWTHMEVLWPKWTEALEERLAEVESMLVAMGEEPEEVAGAAEAVAGAIMPKAWQMVCSCENECWCGAGEKREESADSGFDVTWESVWEE
ncbi:hypothetical protein NA57DRAFT_73084 [Rhizodiscina lignyota]|uniref:Uncharacterized protein n=1 Tax=Rhizodiscina lignyota TaxID=1504668 RepID=A0A9P4ILJ0_9PEZI|nr:hypothetical protein NA57DRAFT_73084 [Rhizodiscina lignyota]